MCVSTFAYWTHDWIIDEQKYSFIDNLGQFIDMVHHLIFCIYA